MNDDWNGRAIAAIAGIIIGWAVGSILYEPLLSISHTIALITLVVVGVIFFLGTR